MPQEIRRLMFDENEVMQAIMDLNTRANCRYFPDGHIASMEIIEEPTPQLKIVVETGVNKTDENTIDTATIGASLIGYCIRKHIPLPAKANKSLKIYKGRLLIDIKVG